MTTRYIPAKEVAVIIRGELKEAFPGQKFSVTTDGNAVRVRWMDGPSSSQVKAITDKFKGSTFDMMQDLKEIVKGEYQGETVSFGSHYIFTDRSYSQGLIETVIAAIKLEYGELAANAKVTGSEKYGFYLSGITDFWTDDAARKMLQNHTTYPAQAPTEPSQGTTEPSQGTTEPSQGTTEPSQGTTEPSQAAPIIMIDELPSSSIVTVITINALPSQVKAKGAFNGTSHTPDRREQSTINSYISHMGQIAQEFAGYATGENAQAINQALEEYRAAYAQRLNAYLAAHSRIFSQMITGPAGWTASQVRSMQKKNETCDRRAQELSETSAKILGHLREQFDPKMAANAPIMATDPDAISLLQTKIDQAKAHQERMKATNAAIRKFAKAGYDAQVGALIALGHSDQAARALLTPNCFGTLGYEAFELSNNNANIKRMETRIAEIQHLKSTPTTEETGVNDTRFIDNTTENRYQLFFPGIPSKTIRSTLKTNGFRWTPSQGCWQAFRTYRASQIAQGVLKGQIV